MTKQPFDNTGAAQVQAMVLGLPIDSRLKEVQAIRTQPTVWLQKHFDFTASQLDQLMSLPEEVITEIGQGIADAWQDGVMIAFNKDDEDDDKGFKDLLFENTNHRAYNFHTGAISSSYVFSIWITYH